MKTKLPIAILLFVILGCVQMASPSTASACSCAPPGTPGDALQQAHAVFSGKVRSITPTQFPSPYGSYMQNVVVFEVTDVWKGPSRSELVLTAGPTTCDYSFVLGQDYLVYAYRWDQKPSIWVAGKEFALPFAWNSRFGTSICSRTAPLAQAGQDLAALGPGGSPAKRDLLEPALQCLPYALGLLLLAAAAIWLYRKLRARQREALR